MLPKEIIKAETEDPKKLLIYSLPKVGKTTLLSQLPNNLIIDLEDGTNYVDALKIKAETINELFDIIKELKKKEVEYDYITIDTISALEDLVMPYACKLYKETPIGKNFDGDNVFKLPNGAGYLYHREAFMKVIKALEKLPKKGLILVGHLREKLVDFKGKEVSAKDIDLTGKLSSILGGYVDSIAYAYRENNNVIFTFKNSENVICGSRSNHLRGQDVIISELENDELRVHWEKIYKELNK
jgi:hypothetical protein